MATGTLETSRIAELLQPFLDGSALAPAMLEQLRRYLELLQRWNARMNLTAIRDPQQVVTRHFGESLLAAQTLAADLAPSATLADVGSGAGFPGIPIKLFIPQIELTLIESKSKKSTFLREVLRALELSGVQVFCGRAEDWGKTANAVTLRAVEQFEQVLPVAARLVSPGGQLCLLIGSAQAEAARRVAGDPWTWAEPKSIPLSSGRVVMVGKRHSS